MPRRSNAPGDASPARAEQPRIAASRAADNMAVVCAHVALSPGSDGGMDPSPVQWSDLSRIAYRKMSSGYIPGDERSGGHDRSIPQGDPFQNDRPSANKTPAANHHWF